MKKPAGKSRLKPAADEAVKQRRDFLAQIGSVEPFQQLFNQIPGVYLFMKDRESRLMWGNTALFQRLGVTEDELVGTKDHRYFPEYVARLFVRDDQKVMRTGRPLLNRVAVWYNEQRILDWFVKNKVPLRDRAGKIIGLVGILQSYEGMKHAHTPYAELSTVIDHIRNHLGANLTVEGLAKLGGVSSRQLHRKFRRAFGLSVQDFLSKTRIQAAQDALVRTSQSIAEIALSLGYCDQSAFTQQFRRNTGVTPRRFRTRNTVKVAAGMA